jgi:hypothetical protein
VLLSIDAFVAVEVLKTVSFEAVIMSSRLKSAENRRQWVIEQIFGELKDDGGYLLMPEDWRLLIEANPGDTAWKQRSICDYIAGMTVLTASSFMSAFSDVQRRRFRNSIKDARPLTLMALALLISIGPVSAEPTARGIVTVIDGDTIRLNDGQPAPAGPLRRLRRHVCQRLLRRRRRRGSWRWPAPQESGQSPYPLTHWNK